MVRRRSRAPPAVIRRFRAARRRAARARGIRRRATYQSQLFTETFKVNTTGPSPSSVGVTTSGEIQIPMPGQQLGGKFMFKMTDLPQ